MIGNDARRFFFDHAIIIIERLEYHLSYLISEVEGISKKVSNLDDQERLISLASWLKKGHALVKEASDFHQTNQEQFLTLLGQIQKDKTDKSFSS